MIDFSDTVKAKTDAELLKMVTGFSEWSPEMLSAVEKELRERNILPAGLKEKREAAANKYDEQLYAGKKASDIGIVFGWILCLGWLGFFIGYHYNFSKTQNLISGQIYYKYDESSRRMGRNIMRVSGLIIGISLLIVLFKSIETI